MNQASHPQRPRVARLYKNRQAPVTICVIIKLIKKVFTEKAGAFLMLSFVFMRIKPNDLFGGS